jgi:hemoglobin/transferrin/lactoferrin receptor protein
MLLYGLYSKLKMSVTEALNIESGVRFSGSKTSVNYEQDEFFDWPEYFYSGIENKTNNLSFLSGLNLDLGLFQLNVLGGTAFRAPNIDDLAKIRVNANEIVIPNPDLKPERTRNIEIQTKLGSKDNFISGSVYLIKLQDAIIREGFNLPNGSDVFISEGQILNVAANVNAKNASVRGINLNVGYKPIEQVSILGSLSITEGVVNNIDGSESPLGHIPPIFGKLNAKYTLSNTSQQLRLNFNLKKPIEDFGGSVDNPDLATSEGSLGWHTINYYSSYSLSETFDLDVAVENILDLHYRPFSSGISAPGRNIIFTIRARLF